MFGSYLINKITVGLNYGLDTATGPGADSHDNVSVPCGEYLGDGCHQAGLDALGVLIGISFKFATSR